MDKASITVAPVDSENVVFTIEAHDPSILDKEATFRLLRAVEVKDDRAIHDSTMLYECNVRWEGQQAHIPISPGEHEIYTYLGHHINVRTKATLVIDDGLIYDTTLHYDYQLPLDEKPPTEVRSQYLLRPYDSYGTMENLSALPRNMQVQIGLAMAVLAFAFMGFVAMVIVVFVFPQLYRSLGMSFPLTPLALYAAFLGFGAFGLWGWMKKKMRGYMVFRHGPNMARPILRDKPVAVSDLIDGRAQIDIDELTIRIVAVNIERGQYRRGGGTNVRTVSFREPVRGVVIYHKTLEDIRKGQTLAEHLDGELADFDRMFERLYPAKPVSMTHGLSIEWEIQVLHPLFIDREFRGRSDLFDYRHFLPGWEALDMPEASVQSG